MCIYLQFTCIYVHFFWLNFEAQQFLPVNLYGNLLSFSCSCGKRVKRRKYQRDEERKKKLHFAEINVQFQQYVCYYLLYKFPSATKTHSRNSHFFHSSEARSFHSFSSFLLFSPSFSISQFVKYNEQMKYAKCAY